MRVKPLAGLVLTALVVTAFAVAPPGAALAAEACTVDFHTAYEAALTRAPEALPTLTAFMRQAADRVLIPEHALDIEWPVALDFVWGAYGPEGYPVLVEIAAESGDPVMVEAALAVLCTSEYPDALPVARRLAIEGETARIRRAAVRLLGWHGRARDWERLLIGLMSDDVDDVSASLWAIHKSGDYRAVSYAIPFCSHHDPWIRDEALSILALACTPQSIEAVQKVCEDRPDDTDLDEFAFYTDAVLWIAGLDRATYCALAPADKEQAIARARAILYGPRPGTTSISRNEALAMVAQWTEKGCINCNGPDDGLDSPGPDDPGLDDVEHQIAAALVRDDIPLLQELRASLYRRLSNETLRDIATVERIMQRVVRRDLAGKGP